MNVMDAIYGRRSIRKFKADSVSKELIERILDAATRAPSAMNRQPWRFVVLQGGKKDELLEIVQRRLDRMKLFGKLIIGAKATVKHMKAAPVLILVFNTEKRAGGLIRFFRSAVDVLFIQSIGAAIQTMLLAAHEHGLGSLWVGHLFFVVRKIRKFIGRNEEFIAAVSIGYPDETPSSRPRKALYDAVTWLS